MPSHYWSQSRGSSVPHDAAVCGKDKDGADEYLGRAFHDGDLLPAKIVPKHGGAFVCYAGSEIKKPEYEVLCGGNLAWQSAKGGDIPYDAVVVGQTSNGERLYAGRVMYDGTLTLGKVHPSHGVCYIPYGGKEHHFANYEILVSK